MIPQWYTTKYGHELLACPTDRFKAGLLTVSAVQPIAPGEAFKTSLLLSVLRRGCEKYPTLEALNRRLDYLFGTELGIRNFYRGDSQIIGFSADVLSSACLPACEDLLSEAMDVMRQILFHPLLDENGLLLERYVESEKQQQCDHIRALRNNPRGYAAEECRRLLFENEPCGETLYGREEDVIAITARELTAHWRRLIDGLYLHGFYVGAEPAQRVLTAFENAFGDLLKSADASSLRITPTVIRRAEKVRRAQECLPVGQSQLLLAFRTDAALGEEAYYACSLFNEMLGASPISKLFMNLRERLSLCYFCTSRYNAYKGTLTVHCGIDKANRELAEQEILAQIKALAQGDFSDEELVAAKSSIANAYRQMEDNPSAMENFYFGRALVGVEQDTNRLRCAFECLTREDVMRAASALTLDTVYFLEGTLSGEEEYDGDER